VFALAESILPKMEWGSIVWGRSGSCNRPICWHGLQLFHLTGPVLVSRQAFCWSEFAAASRLTFGVCWESPLVACMEHGFMSALPVVVGRVGFCMVR